MIVTTFSPKGYESYGREMLESAVKHYPGDILVYYDKLPDVKSEKITYRPLSSVFGHDAFVQYCERNPVFEGQILGGYSYTYDAKRFCHKVFAQFDALKRYEGKIYWVDADCVFFRDFDLDVFDGKPLALLQREGFHSETGFIGFDTNAPGLNDFLEVYINLYRKGLLFTLNGWHDARVVDEAVKISGVEVNNLSPFFEFQKGLAVLEKSILGQVMYHKKGQLAKRVI